MLYLLNIKDTLAAQSKKIIYSLLSLSAANEFIDKCRFIHKVFGGFIIGKLVDSLIIGVLTFVWLSIIEMPYAVLISVASPTSSPSSVPLSERSPAPCCCCW